MSLHDEFEAVKHAPHELMAWVKSLLVKLEGEPKPPEVTVPAPVEQVIAEPAAPEGQEHT